jgi:hypothetical protein
VWLRHYATSQKVAGLIHNVLGFFTHCGPGVDLASKPKLLPGTFLGVKGSQLVKADNFTAICGSIF